MMIVRPLVHVMMIVSLSVAKTSLLFSPGQVVSTSGQPSLLFRDTGFNLSWHKVYTSMTPSLLFHDSEFTLP